ncbi:Vi polysaccharide biosynthesis UDP-N-acetylglucosamine C-6 dehydrogenase TviB [Pedobacter hiemivivus]|uniref:Vi polysaccharide biosynthesis UDP-N-acetylglucosamine C-6 dehydrogenase TviB n=1 Tax=Pedobacter hiemivivus TaxID=2530454 RepID=A0A4U1FYZ6_9SPHI|nr:Vi polysaccharide biosynthesis UDP-N-acetylglucosamine C-6 dehydrogenase TviB [Pedobacter hiemivivus]TKC56238.1 Vi polysaccharide biosynthesis UDP-N-acetylglucosamine C-6 dehydrogenase TviB [Pedobacter hiemivivus]
MLDAHTKIAIIGLGYVGLPLAVEFAKKYKTFGFDINGERIAELNSGFDHTLEISSDDLNHVLTYDCTSPLGLYCTGDIEKIKNCSVYIVTVPTPVDKNNRPDLTPLVKASITVGQVLKKGDIVIYESTVYPGVTEDECVPVLAKTSGLKFNIDFFAGYSPERINPGDKSHTVANILKITSGSTAEIAEIVDQLYNSIITAGTHKASSIKVAEAAKIIENAQRDINIAFVNELAMIFNRLGINTNEVLDAAGTKWNFLNFRPGLVGGHCIGVDPYYLAQKAQEVGYHPEIILAGRRVNDGMGAYVADQLIKQMIQKNTQIIGAKVLVLGFTFKENCPDVRNTKVIDIINRLKEYNVHVTVHDPWANVENAKHEYGIVCENGESKTRKYDGILLAVAHQEFKSIDLRELCKKNGVIYDVKSMLPDESVDFRL